MEQHIFGMFIDYRVHRKEGVAIYNATQVTLQQKTLVLLNQKCIFQHYRGFQSKRNLLIDIIFVMKIFSSGNLFRAAVPFLVFYS